METVKSSNDFKFPLNPPSHTKTFVINCQNHAIEFRLSDIEMVVLQASEYTSIKDLLPSSPTSILSPTASRMDSWREIPIKDPLLQHAAWAYLQPMGAVSDSGDRNLLEKFKEKCCGFFGCFNEVFLAIRNALFSESDDQGWQRVEAVEVEEDKQDG